MKSTDDARTRTDKKSGQCGSRPDTSKDGDSQDIPEVSSTAVQQVLLARIAKEQAKADAIRARAKAKAARILAKGEYKASIIEQKAQGTYKKKVRMDVHGRPKPLMRGWIHLVAAPLALAAGIVLICLAPCAGLKCVIRTVTGMEEYHHTDYVDIYRYRAADTCCMDQCPALAVYGYLHYFRCIRSSIPAPFLAFPACWSGCSLACCSRRGMLHTGGYSISAAQA